MSSAMSSELSEFQEMRRERNLCDAVLNVAGVEFPVHKVILCRCSPYFTALFIHWSSPDCEYFRIHHLSADMMEIILDYAYTGVIRVTEENLQELFIAADHFNITGIIQACSWAMGEQLSPENAIATWWFSDTYSSPELKGKAYEYILKHFEAVLVSSKGDFLQLSADDLREIIGEDRLNVRQESTVFEAVLSWIQHAPHERERHFIELLPKIRLARINPLYFLRCVQGCELVRQSRDCRVLTKIAFKLMRDTRSNASLFSNPLARPRLPRAILVAIGGWIGQNPVNVIEAFDNRANCWLGVPNDDQTPRAYHGTVFLNGSLYLIGGCCDQRTTLQTVHRYDLGNRTWQEVAPMHSKRCYISVALLDGLIYVMGGCDRQLRLQTAERYTPDTNQWTMIAPMHEVRSDASSAAHGGKIYICGGFDGELSLSTAECYSPQSDQWTMIAEMSCRRSGLGVIAHGNAIYAVGGFSGLSCLDSMEAYNPETNTWRSLPDMLRARSNFGLEVLEERLYVLGGYKGSGVIRSVESFNLNTGVWSREQNMSIPRSGLSCSVVFDLPNMADYAATLLPPSPPPSHPPLRPPLLQDIDMEE